MRSATYQAVTGLWRRESLVCCQLRLRLLFLVGGFGHVSGLGFLVSGWFWRHCAIAMLEVNHDRAGAILVVVYRAGGGGHLVAFKITSEIFHRRLRGVSVFPGW